MYAPKQMKPAYCKIKIRSSNVKLRTWNCTLHWNEHWQLHWYHLYIPAYDRNVRFTRTLTLIKTNFRWKGFVTFSELIFKLKCMLYRSSRYYSTWPPPKLHIQMGELKNQIIDRLFLLITWRRENLLTQIRVIMMKTPK